MSRMYFLIDRVVNEMRQSMMYSYGIELSCVMQKIKKNNPFGRNFFLAT